jgi:hypothetical protein
MRAVMANSLPAPLPKSAMPGATNPKMMRGMIKERKPENMEVMVTNILTPHIGKNSDATIPATMAMITFGSKPILNLKLIFVLSDY